MAHTPPRAPRRARLTRECSSMARIRILDRFRANFSFLQLTKLVSRSFSALQRRVWNAAASRTFFQVEIKTSDFNDRYGIMRFPWKFQSFGLQHYKIFSVFRNFFYLQWRWHHCRVLWWSLKPSRTPTLQNLSRFPWSSLSSQTLTSPQSSVKISNFVVFNATTSSRLSMIFSVFIDVDVTAEFYGFPTSQHFLRFPWNFLSSMSLTSLQSSVTFQKDF